MPTRTFRLHANEQTETYKQLVREERQHGYLGLGCHLCVDRDAHTHQGRSLERPSMYDKDDPSIISILVLVDPKTGVTAEQEDSIRHAIHLISPESAAIEYGPSWNEAYPRVTVE